MKNFEEVAESNIDKYKKLKILEERQKDDLLAMAKIQFPDKAERNSSQVDDSKNVSIEKE